jgi:hypothetical protein
MANALSDIGRPRIAVRFEDWPDDEEKPQHQQG